MYQGIVLGLGVLLLGGGGYLITTMDSQDVIGSALETKVVATSTDPGDHSQTISGRYLCDVGHGCEDPRLLTLLDNGEAQLLTMYANGAEQLKEYGTWNAAKGIVALMLVGTSQDDYDRPERIHLRPVTPRTITTISAYKDFGSPVFKKEEGGL